MIRLEISDMIGTFNVHQEDKRFNQKQINAMKEWNRVIESSWYHPKNIYKAYNTPTGKAIVRYGLRLL
tara:strand:+ start:421 stop:624 length:204 start_codon:yes stop_codon:yes gene_type:complete